MIGLINTIENEQRRLHKARSRIAEKVKKIDSELRDLETAEEVFLAIFKETE